MRGARPEFELLKQCDQSSKVHRQTPALSATSEIVQLGTP